MATYSFTIKVCHQKLLTVKTGWGFQNMYFSENVEKFALLAGLEFLFFWLGSQDSQFSAPKARKSRNFLHRDKSALIADLPTSTEEHKPWGNSRVPILEMVLWKAECKHFSVGWQNLRSKFLLVWRSRLPRSKCVWLEILQCHVFYVTEFGQEEQ